MLLSAMFALVNTSYSRAELLCISSEYRCAFKNENAGYDIPTDIARPAGAPWIVVPLEKRRRRRRERKQKRGCRAGIHVRLGKNPHKPPLPSLFVTNARSLANKMDELEMITATQKNIQDCCAMIITETWLTPFVPEDAISLSGRTAHRQDRDKHSGKTRGGGLCIYTNNNWCTNANVIDRHCSPDLEYLSVKCRPFYMPREFTCVIVTAVYIPPDANTKIALGCLLTAISKQQTTHLDGVFVVAGDFNQAKLKTVLPKFYQHVQCATRGKNTLDHVYSNIKHGYKASPLPHLGQSDHVSLFLTPAYRPIVNTVKPTVRHIQVWPEGASEQLRDCFSNTEWALFEDNNINTYTSTVLFYIKCCVENVTNTTRIRVFPNNKPWMTRDVQLLLKERNLAFRTGDKELYSASRSKLKRGIRDAKVAYKQRIERHFEDSNPRRAWQGIRHIINHKNSTTQSTDSSASLAVELNNFFGRFEVASTETTMPTVQASASTSQSLNIQTADVIRVLRNINTRKATGPDGVPGRVLKDCADELAGVLTNIYNMSLSQCIVPSCLKSTTIVPVPKQTAITCLNDYRPIALTPIVTKCLERLVLKHIKATLPPTLDPHQYAYRENRSTDDAINIALHTALQHLEQRGTYARLLFVDYSSAFNTIIPSRLVSKMDALGVDDDICRWTQDFLTDRPQSVRMGNHHSPTLTLSMGAPQGVVLSPFFYFLYTHDCIPAHISNTIIKFADDTTVVGLITGGDESAYRAEVERLLGWCSENNLSLNIKKTKELIIDFRRKQEQHPPLFINGEEVERVSSFKFLGTNISDDLTWSKNTQSLVKKSQRRLYFLRSLRKVNLSQQHLVSFYRCTIESVLTYGICIWYGSCSVAEKKALQRVVNSAQKITNTQLPAIEDIYTSRCLQKAKGILKAPTHPAHHLFALLPSGRRYRCLKARTTRLLNSFYPRAITILNAALK